MSSLCDEPGDITFLFLRILGKCCGGEKMTFALYFCRGSLGFCLTTAEAFILAFDVFNLMEMESGASVGVMFAVIVPTIIGLCIHGWMAAQVLSVEGDDFRKERGKYVLASKTMNVIFSAAIAAGTIYGWELIDIENLFKEPEASKIFLIISLGLDILFDPIEMIIGYCIFCRG